MKAKKSLHVRLPSFSIPLWWPDLPGNWRAWLPSRGNVLFTLLVVAGLVLASNVGAVPLSAPSATSSSTISYQGRLADSAGNPLTGYYNLEFRMYDVPAGGTPLWEEFWTGGNSVQVSDGLFDVMLGSINNTLAATIEGHDELYLGITVGTDSEMVPRVQLGSVPFAMYAATANVPDGSITTAKLADGAVTTAKLNVDNSLKVKGATGALLELETQESGSPNFLRFSSASSPDEYGIIGFPNADTKTFEIFNPQPGGSMQFVVPGPTHALYISPSGKVGIKTRDPAATLDVNGDFHASGTKSAVVQAGEFGQRELYAAESPEVRFFDEGLARLENGVARVGLDPIFLETIEGDYLVHVTPYGDASLYVAEIGQDYFVVRAREGDPDVAFAWRLSAHRKGYEGVRLELVRTADGQN